MKIVGLDGHTLNPGDLSWKGLGEFGEYEIHARSSREETLPRARGAKALLTNKTVLDGDMLEILAGEGLRYVGVLATGVNVVDIASAARLGVTVTNAPGYGTAAVAQAVFALLLELTNRAGRHDQAVREGRWSSSPDFCFWDYPQLELEGLKLGILGYGAIGRAVARIGRAFGVEILVHTRSPQAKEDAKESMETDAKTEFTDLDVLFRESDVLSLHAPLTEATRGIINKSRLRQMKKSAFLINTARGPLVDEDALAHALREGEIAGAGLDVLSQEPPSPDNPLLDTPNCVITPHIAWAGRRARARLLEIVLENLRAFLQGRPRNVVKP